jgi:hypothetical protein
MKRFVQFCAAGLATVLCMVASAGQVTGTVSLVLARATDGLTYVYISGTASGKPACATGSYWMIMNETSDAGHKQYAMLLEAAATGATVTVVGNNTCTRWSDGEDINYIELVGH